MRYCRRVGRRLNCHRLSCGLTRAQVANAMELPESTIVRWECGTLRAEAEELVELALILAVADYAALVQ